jgi:serine protease Do
MSSRSNRLALLAVGLIGFLVGVAASVRFDLFPHSEAINIFGGADKPAATSNPSPSPVVALPDFAGLAEHVAPSVVNISTTQEVKTGSGLGGPGGSGGPGGPGGEDDPFHDFFGPFERFFGPPHGGRPYKAKSLGSGFVIDPSGYILTNNHVVENADEIVVKLPTGKEFKAKVVGRDQKTDIALIEIHGATDLTPVGGRDRQPVRAREHRDRRDRQRDGAAHQPGPVRQLHPDRRGHQPGQLRRAAAQHAR